ncbi:ImpA family type VI secretion system protein [Glacieibacterium megasporae]|uniref:type VI secretion system protein TssA n=1 Tax=Glacieibacterium megasporae TaxID=2835787 RepID=UPI001C1E4E92|nr:type VI secretion system ImpA family N-terminal domain-containing protein [Polymorphobacter megasporae]UAJ09839.1 type VI secretion system ImpA family N-terminal domain-containing protein [Polymorphobacter megasporae]
MPFDFNKLSAPISEDAPVGPYLRDDPAFRDIEDAPGEFANQSAGDLRKVVNRCVEFLEKTKDQTPAIVAVQASVRAGDFAVANAALELIKSFAELYWEDFHPGPAEEMAIGRVNELSSLSRPAALILPLQRAAIARLPAPSTVEFTSAMLVQASGTVLEWTNNDDTSLAAKITSGAISAVAAKTGKSTHEGARLLRVIMRSIAPEAAAADATAEAAAGSSNTVEGIDSAQASAIALGIRAQVTTAAPPLRAMADILYDIMAIYDGHSVDSPSFGPVIAQLKSMDAAVEGFLVSFPDPNAVVEVEDGETVMETALVPGDTTASAKPRAFSADPPRTRADVLAAIDAICRYYADNEPTSPVPLMLKRIRSWVDKDFMELIREIAPNGADEVTRLLAIKSE